jgi:pimeloyl-ACP methyl ester carboxylesterase
VPVSRTNGPALFSRTFGCGPDLVLVHGLGASHAFWYPRVARELARDHRVTVYDLRGHGRSAMPRSGYSVQTMAADLEHLLDALHITRARIAGHSFGGVVTLELALRAPSRVADLVVADARLPQLEGRRRDGLDFRALERMARVEPGGRTLAGDRSGFTPFGGWGGGQRSRRRWLELMSATTAARDFDRAGPSVRALRNLCLPVLALYGERSVALPSGRALAAIVPNCRLELVPRSGHFHPVAEPLAFVAAVRAAPVP